MRDKANSEDEGKRKIKRGCVCVCGRGGMRVLRCRYCFKLKKKVKMQR